MKDLPYKYPQVTRFHGNFSHIKCPPLKLQDYEFMKYRDQNKPKEETQLNNRYFNRVYSSFKQGRSKSVNPEYIIMAMFDTIEPKKKVETQISQIKPKLIPINIARTIETQINNKENRYSSNKLTTISHQNSKTTQRSTILTRETSQIESSYSIHQFIPSSKKFEIDHHESSSYQSGRVTSALYNRCRQSSKIR